MSIDKVGIKMEDLMKGNEAAASQAMPPQVAQASEAVSKGVNADQIVQACGSPEKATKLLEQVAGSQGVSLDVKVKAAELITQINASQNLQGAATPQAVGRTDNIFSVDMSGKDKGAMA